KRAADHHLVVGAAADVGAELLRWNAVFEKISGGFGVRRYAAAGRDVVRGDVVPEHEEDARAADRRRRISVVGEGRWPAQEQAVGIPGEQRLGAVGNLGPFRSGFGERVVGVVKQVAGQRLFDTGADVGVGRPDVGEEYGPAGGVVAQFLAREIGQDGAGD